MIKVFMIYTYEIKEKEYWHTNEVKKYVLDVSTDIKFFYSDSTELPDEAVSYIEEIKNNKNIGRCIMKVGLTVPKEERGVLKSEDRIWSKNKYYIVNTIMPKNIGEDEYVKYEYNPEDIDENQLIRNWKKRKMERALSK